MRSKYGNVKTTVDNIAFDSKKEAARYAELKMLLRSRIITGLEMQKEFSLRVNGVLICTYVADFSYFGLDGREVIEDGKGLKTGAAYQMFRVKSKLMIAVYGLRVIEV